MWRRTYLLLVLVRLYFALSPSYLHPDENFQGPEVIAGQIFSYPVHLTWEFTSQHPIRSVFPLWPVYGLPMMLLHWVWSGGADHHDISPKAVFWTLRGLMFVLSFVLEDWAIHELVPSPRHRRIAVLLVASSYVTWTFQTHTFSNSVETLVIAWSLVWIRRIVENKQKRSTFACGILAFLAVFGFFNRITFPAFLLIPGLRLFPHLIRHPLSLCCALVVGVVTTAAAILLDTSFYTSEPLTLATILQRPVITPLNNFFYNSDSRNLVEHGLHPYYQHLVANLPQLLGPAYFLLARPRLTLPLISALSGVLVLSLVRHQEARFLIPTIPLILSSVRLPGRFVKGWLATWVGFNVVLGLLMGMYHQGGVIPTQLFLADQADATHALWWRTYSPPIWLLNGKNNALTTKDLMGMPPDDMLAELYRTATCHNESVAASNVIDVSSSTAGTGSGTYLIAPESSTYLDRFTHSDPSPDFYPPILLKRAWHYRHHLNLDDLDLASEGVWPTLQRVIGRRGLTTWRVTKAC